MAKSRDAVKRKSLKGLLSEIDSFVEANPDLNANLETHPNLAEQPDPSKQTKVGRMLKRAAEANNPYVYSFILQTFLAKIGLTAPSGVFSDLVTRDPGRPLEEYSQFRAWLEYTKMETPTDVEVARILIPTYWKANKKKAADRIRRRRKRFEERISKEDRADLLHFVLSGSATKPLS